MSAAAIRGRARELAGIIGSKHGIPTADILGRGRRADIASARRELYVALWRDGFSIADVGRILERDHTTILHGMRVELGACVYDREIQERYPGPGCVKAYGALPCMSQAEGVKR